MKQYSITDTWEYLSKLENPKEPVWELVEQIGRRQAWVVRDTANDILCLQSYHTIVSMKVGDEHVRLGHWSRTTSAHQSAFYRY